MRGNGLRGRTGQIQIDRVWIAAIFWWLGAEQMSKEFPPNGWVTSFKSPDTGKD